MGNENEVEWASFFAHWSPDVQLMPEVARELGVGIKSVFEPEFALFVERYPKTELHVHLEAGVSPGFYDALGVRKSVFPYASFLDFIKDWCAHSLLITTEQMIETMVIDFYKQRSLQNIVYTECYISPLDFTLVRPRISADVPPLNLTKILSSYLSGAKKAKSLYPHVDVRFIVDFLWPSSIEVKYELLNILLDIKNNKIDVVDNQSLIVAFGLGGPEQNQFAPEQVNTILEVKKKLNLPLDIHSGEMTSYETHHQNCFLLSPDRVSHGFLGRPDYQKIPLLFCPLSNKVTGAFSKKISEYELPENASVHSDDPLFFRNTLTLDYCVLKKAGVISFHDFENLQQRARQSRFA